MTGTYQRQAAVEAHPVVTGTYQRQAERQAAVEAEPMAQRQAAVESEPMAQRQAAVEVTGKRAILASPGTT